VSAYLGAAASIANKQYLTAAGSILTVETRHNTYLIGTNGGNPVPVAFSTPLDFDEVYSLASAFIVSCPASNPVIPVKAFPALSVQGTGAVSAGECISVSGSWTDGIYAVILSGLDSYAVAVEDNKFKFPSDPTITGQVYLVFSTAETATDDTIIAGPAILVANE
jgi:Ferritin-like domain